MKTITFSGKCENGFRVKNHIDPETDTGIFKDFDTTETTNMSYMFADCSQLKHIIGLETFNTSNVQDMSSMFSDCTCVNIYIKDISKWDVQNVRNMNSMFCNNLSLKHVDFHLWKTPKLETCENMFKNCKNLKTVRLDEFGSSLYLKNIRNMFKRCVFIRYVNIPKIYLNPELSIYQYSMFDNAFILKYEPDNYDDTYGHIFTFDKLYSIIKQMNIKFFRDTNSDETDSDVDETDVIDSDD